jgi:hypothetical protein
MLTDQDLQKINKTIELRLELFKEDFYTKPEMDAKFSQILTAIDGITQAHLKLDKDSIILNYRMKQAEDWIDKAAPKVGVRFEH